MQTFELPLKLFNSQEVVGSSLRKNIRQYFQVSSSKKKQSLRKFIPRDGVPWRNLFRQCNIQEELSSGSNTEIDSIKSHDNRLNGNWSKNLARRRKRPRRRTTKSYANASRTWNIAERERVNLSSFPVIKLKMVFIHRAPGSGLAFDPDD